MAVTVDHQPLRANDLGLRTVGQVLAHLQKGNRLVVHVLIDGREPEPGRLGAIRRQAIEGHELFIETASAAELAGEAIDEVEQQLREADRLRAEAADLLRRGLHVKAMERLSGCFSTWQHAQESVLKTAQLLRLDLNALRVRDQTLAEMLGDFTGQLREIKLALEDRDFVLLTDILTYEVKSASDLWTEALEALRAQVRL